MTDRPADPRPDPADPQYAEPALDTRTSPTDLRDDRPRVVRDDGVDDAAGRVAEREQRDTAVSDRSATVPVDERPAYAGGRRELVDPATGRNDGAYLADPTRVREREEDAMGGIKWGSAFFGWLTAMGVTAILTALLTAAGTALAVNNEAGTSAAADLAATDTETARTIGLTGAVAVLLVLFVAYLAGGYVAGRMARVDGPRQGFGVWVWMVGVAVVAAIAATVAGSAYDVLARLNTYPRMPIDAGQLATAGAVTLVLALVVTLVGALLGGALGMGYHRRMDAVGLGLVRPEGDARTT